MGTDISIYAERRSGEGRSGQNWQLAEPAEWRQEMIFGKWPGDAFWEPTALYSDRNYALCALLLNARNSDCILPIAPERGLPDEMSPELQCHVERRGGGWGSWLYVSELLLIDWHALPVQHRAWVAPEVAGLFEAGKPLPREVADDVPWATEARSVAEDWVEVRWASWDASLAQRVGDEWMRVMERLRAMGPADEMRIVCW